MSYCTISSVKKVYYLQSKKKILSFHICLRDDMTITATTENIFMKNTICFYQWYYRLYKAMH